jgi:hypothetical protein
MKPLTLAFAALVATTFFAASPARADYSIVQWGSGDCTIWDEVGLYRDPVGGNWARVVVGIPTWGEAKVVLEGMYRQGMCR